MRARDGARELEIGEVGAGDQKDESCQPEQQRDDLNAGRVHGGGLKRDRAQSVRAVFARAFLSELLSQRAQAGVELTERKIGTGTADDAQRAVGAVQFFLVGQSKRAKRVAGTPQEERRKRGGHYADDGGGLAIDAYGLADRLWIAAEVREPGRVADDDDVITRPILVGGEEASDLGLKSEDREEIGGDAQRIEIH